MPRCNIAQKKLFDTLFHSRCFVVLWGVHARAPSQDVSNNCACTILNDIAEIGILLYNHCRLTHAMVRANCRRSCSNKNPHSRTCSVHFSVTLKACESPPLHQRCPIATKYTRFIQAKLQVPCENKMKGKNRTGVARAVACGEYDIILMEYTATDDQSLVVFEPSCHESPNRA